MPLTVKENVYQYFKSVSLGRIVRAAVAFMAAICRTVLRVSESYRKQLRCAREVVALFVALTSRERSYVPLVCGVSIHEASVLTLCWRWLR